MLAKLLSGRSGRVSRCVKMAIVCLLAGAGSFFAAGTAEAQTTTNVNVDATKFVVPTGLQVTQGETVMITATGLANMSATGSPYITDPTGTITTAPSPGSGSYSFFQNSAAVVGVAPVVGIQKLIIAPFPGQLENAPYGLLVAGFSAKSNASSPGDFPNGFVAVGASATLTAPFNGFLYLAVNDFNNTVDNGGGYSATVVGGAPPIAAVEVTQAIQQFQLLANLKASLAASNEPPVPIISGKPAVLRIYFNEVQNVTLYTIQATGAVNATKALPVAPNCDPTFERGSIDACRSMDFYFTPPPDAWNVNLSVTDSNGNIVEQELLNFVSRDTQPLHIIGASVCDSMDANGNWLCGSPTDLIGKEALLSRMAPTNSVIFDVGRDTAMNDHSRLSNDSWLNLSVQDVNGFYGLLDRTNDTANNTHTLYFGSYRTVVDSTGMAIVGGRGAISPAFVPRLGIDATATIFAHEASHTLSLRHTNVPVTVFDVSPPGCYNFAQDPGTNWPFPNNAIQSHTGVEWGFDVASQAVLDPNVTFELMSYCYPRWISPINYKTEITTLGGGTVSSPSIKSAPPVQEDAVIPRPEISTPMTGPFMQVSGTVGSSGFTFNPLFTNTMTGSTDPGSGTYSIVVQNTLGQSIYTRFFTPVSGQTDIATGPDLVFDPVFSEWIPAVTGAATIIVEDPNGVSLGTLTLTGTALQVTLTSPAKGFVAIGPQPVSWTVSPACANCTARVLYSSNNGSTWGQIGQIQGSTTLMTNFSTLPGSTSGGSLIQVLVSDGINTGVATSVPFSVAKSSPTIIQIESPQAGYAQAAADPIQLIGEAYDPDDGMLHGSQLVWSSNVQGVLGSGSPLTATLQAGTHQITLTATDSDGNTISAPTSVIIGGTAPVLTLSTKTLATNCVSATITATLGNQGAPLSIVQYSLNGGVTYTSIPLTQLPYSFVVPGSSAVNLVAYASDVSRQIAAQSILVNLTGGCITGVPSISGGSTQSAIVGAAFPTPLSVLVSDGNGNPVSGVSVSFTAPTAGAAATLSAATATSASTGIASVTATANSTNGSYNVVATVPGFSTTAQFNLTNTDFTLAVDGSSLTVVHGSSGTATITATPLSGFNSSITLACTGLPVGVTCSFSPSTLTPTGGAMSSTLTITVASNASTSTAVLRWTLSGGGFALAFCVLGSGMRRRRKYFGVPMLLCLIAIVSSTMGCAFSPFTSMITVTASSGAAQHSSTISLAVK